MALLPRHVTDTPDIAALFCIAQSLSLLSRTEGYHVSNNGTGSSVEDGLTLLTRQ